MLDVGGIRLLSDPLLGRHAGLLRRRGPGPRAADWHGARAILLSHLHHDHAELSSLRKLPGVPIMTAPANAGWIQRHGLSAPATDSDPWWRVGDVVVRLVDAEHRSRPMPHRPNAANGHLVIAGDVRVWVAGDTSLYPGLEELPDLAGGRIDLAVVPIAGWGPRLSAGHLGPVEAAEACRRVQARYALPVHWGTLRPPGAHLLPTGWMDRPAREFVAALAERAPECRARVLTPGERRDFGADDSVGPAL